MSQTERDGSAAVQPDMPGWPVCQAARPPGSQAARQKGLKGQASRPAGQLAATIGVTQRDPTPRSQI